MDGTHYTLLCQTVTEANDDGYRHSCVGTFGQDMPSD